MIDPELTEAHIGLGAIHSWRYFNMWGGLDDLRVAEESYLAAFGLEPTSMPARRGLMHVESERGHQEEVLIHAREARRAGRPHDVESLLAEAEGYAIGGLTELSLPIFRRVVELDPLNGLASWWLVLGSAWTGQFEVAVQATEDYLNRIGDDGQVHTWAGVSLYVLGRTDEAQAHYQSATGGRADLASLTSLIFSGHLLQEAGQREEALSTWQAGLETIRSREELVGEHSRLSVLAATLETLLYGASSQQSLLEELDQSGYVDFNTSLLAAAIAKQGDWQQAVEVLFWTLDREFILMNWKIHFWALGLDPAAPELAEFRQLFEAKRLELEERFGPSDPLQEIPARQ